MLEELKLKIKSVLFDVCELIGKDQYLYSDYGTEFINSYLIFNEDSFELLKLLLFRDFCEKTVDTNLDDNVKLLNFKLYFIVGGILTDYTKLRMGKKDTMVMKSLVREPKDRSKILLREISMFEKRWGEIVNSLEDYYISFDTLDYTSKSIVHYISICLGNISKVEKLNKKYGRKYID